MDIFSSEAIAVALLGWLELSLRLTIGTHEAKYNRTQLGSQNIICYTIVADFERLFVKGR